MRSNPKRKRKKISKAAMRRRMARVRAGRKINKRRARKKPSSYTSQHHRRRRVAPTRKRRRRRYRPGRGNDPVLARRLGLSKAQLKSALRQVRRSKRVRKNPRRGGSGAYFAIRSGGKTALFRASSKPHRLGSFSAKGLRNWARSHNVKIR